MNNGFVEKLIEELMTEKTKYQYVCIKTNDLIEIIEKKDFKNKIKQYSNKDILNIVCGNEFSELEKIFNIEKTFYEELVDNNVSINDIDIYIEKWKKSNSIKTIYEYLGMTNKQYEIYVEQGIIHI